jgi:signal peptidase I
MIAATLGLVMVAAADAHRLARRTRPDYQPKTYNSPAVYLLLGLMIQGSSVGYALHVRASLFEAFRVPSASTYPAIVINDRILVDKTAYRKADPQRGDLVLFKPPNEHWRTHYIKRIVALAGDTVRLEHGHLYINGRELDRLAIQPTALGAPPLMIDGRTRNGDFFVETNGTAQYPIFLENPSDNPPPDFAEVTIPKHHCFVLGDNRNHSLDSRHLGPIPYAAIRGRADYVYWPAQKWSRFGRLR